ncbi:DEAD/DEAH box helicase [Enterococcus sp. AZ102]|uniref:DEAD/DEAH box helicase n=1 Tax=Enterococcus sp. AZ102 TaxID=2774865 RepID=UPI003F23319A
MATLEEGLQKGFIDRQILTSRYVPKMIINQPEKKEFLANVLQEELSQCETFDFSVAFITQSGLNALKVQLADLYQHGKKGRLLTSTYLAFNAPEIFYALLRIPNLDVRISETPGFHAKGYLFKQAEHTSFIIGSSNLTLQALKQNYEWNVLLTSKENGEILHQLVTHFNEEWQKAQLLTTEWILAYQKVYEQEQVKKIKDLKIIDPNEKYVVPNRMQKAALESLTQLRATGAKKGLVISATGTGKTYLAAFDVLQVKPKKMLFVVHREQILRAAQASFKKVIGGQAQDFGIFSGNKRELTAKYVFATVQTLSKPENLALFKAHEFEYILIDEVHKAGAESYLRVLDYFEPEFLLGMTATPERTDNFNIFELFDYNVAYEIRLQDALAEDLLCPFHYFGVTDYEIEGELVDDKTSLDRLTMDDRCHFLLEKLAYYGCDDLVPRGLVFCRSREEAQVLSGKFTDLGHPSSFLTGSHTIQEREQEIERLEKNELEYIFTVDIFNEGIDIPKINQVIMLRATQSNIIFVQQLGRGLRKDPSKEFVTVIDFIGNYQNNYMIPMALSGDVSRVKERLRKDTVETNYLTGLSMINFEEIAKQRVFEAIDRAQLDGMRELRELYIQVKQRLNRIPTLLDLEQSGIMDPLVITDKYKNYPQFLLKIKEIKLTFPEKMLGYFTFFSQELLSGKRKQELLILKKLLFLEKLEVKELNKVFEPFALNAVPWSIRSVVDTLTTDFYRGGVKKTYEPYAFIQQKEQQLYLHPNFQLALANSQFRQFFVDVLETAIHKAARYDHEPFTVYESYRRRDVLRLLGWKEQMVDQNVGGYTYNRERKQFVIFVTLNKGETFSGAQMAYEDQLLDVETMHWFTKAPRSINSPEVRIMLEEEGWTYHLFVKKSDDEGTNFYALGQVIPVNETIKQKEKPTNQGTHKSVVHMNLKFNEPMPYDLFRYFTT